MNCRHAGRIITPYGRLPLTIKIGVQPTARTLEMLHFLAAFEPRFALAAAFFGGARFLGAVWPAGGPPILDFLKQVLRPCILTIQQPKKNMCTRVRTMEMHEFRSAGKTLAKLHRFHLAAAAPFLQ